MSEKLQARLKTLEFQSSLNDSGLPDAELIAAISDATANISIDIDSYGSGNILERVEAAVEMAGKAMESRDEIILLQARIAELEGAFKRLIESETRTLPSGRSFTRFRCKICKAYWDISAWRERESEHHNEGCVLAALKKS